MKWTLKICSVPLRHFSQIPLRDTVNKNLFSELEEKLILFGENITWKFAEQYPSCKNFDLFDHFKDLKNNTPQIIWFKFKLLHNLSVSLFIEERNKQASRTIKAHRLMYIGPTLVMRNMSVSFLHSTVLRGAPLMKNTQIKILICYSNRNTNQG